MMLALLHLSATTTQETRNMDNNALPRQLKNLMENSWMMTISCMLNRLWARLREKLKKRKKCSDTKTQKNGAISMLRIFHQLPPRKFFKTSSPSMEKLKALRYSHLKKTQHNLFMHLYASRHLKEPLKPNQSSITIH